MAFGEPNPQRKRGTPPELAGRIAQAAHDLGVQNVLVVPGAVHIPWRTDHEPVPNDVCDARAKEAVRTPERQAAKLKVSLNIENIFFNGSLMTRMEMNAFADSFQSEHVRVHFDTGNISMFQFAGHWVPILGKRIQNTHFTEFTMKGTDYSLETFRPLPDGAMNWPAVMEALDEVGCRGYVTFEYFHPYVAPPIYGGAHSENKKTGSPNHTFKDFWLLTFCPLLIVIKRRRMLRNSRAVWNGRVLEAAGIRFQKTCDFDGVWRIGSTSGRLGTSRASRRTGGLPSRRV